MSKYKVTADAVDGLNKQRDVGWNLSQLEELRDRIDRQMIEVFNLCNVVKTFEDHEEHGKTARQLLRRWKLIRESKEQREERLRNEREEYRMMKRGTTAPREEMRRRQSEYDCSRRRIAATNRSTRMPIPTNVSRLRANTSVSCCSTGNRKAISKNCDEEKPPGLNYTYNFTWKTPPQEAEELFAKQEDAEYGGLPYVTSRNQRVSLMEMAFPRHELDESSQAIPDSQLKSPKIEPDLPQKFNTPRKNAQRKIAETQRSEMKTRSQTSAEKKAEGAFKLPVPVLQEVKKKPLIKIMIKKQTGPKPPPMTVLDDGLPRIQQSQIVMVPRSVVHPALPPARAKPAKRRPAKNIRMCQEPPTPLQSDEEDEIQEIAEVNGRAVELGIENIHPDEVVKDELNESDMVTEPPTKKAFLSLEDLDNDVEVEPVSPLKPEPPVAPVSTVPNRAFLNKRIPKRAQRPGVPRLFDLCEKAAEKHSRGAFHGRVPFSLLAPLLEKYSDRALFNTEITMTWLEDSISTIWQKRLERDFPWATVFPGESSGEAFRRCQEETEDDRLERLQQAPLPMKPVIRAPNTSRRRKKGGAANGRKRFAKRT